MSWPHAPSSSLRARGGENTSLKGGWRGTPYSGGSHWWIVSNATLAYTVRTHTGGFSRPCCPTSGGKRNAQAKANAARPCGVVARIAEACASGRRVSRAEIWASCWRKRRAVATARSLPDFDHRLSATPRRMTYATRAAQRTRDPVSLAGSKKQKCRRLLRELSPMLGDF